MENTKPVSPPPMPENFISVINDFTNDLSITFPEYSYLWSRWTTKENPEDDYNQLYGYCLTVYPERFFDILYHNDDLFKEENISNTFFLPNVDFKVLFSIENISENTKKTMWKYLQLVLITIMSGINDKSKFGDAANLFDGIDEDELHSKLNETIHGLTDFFKNMESSDGKTDEDGDGEEKEGNPLNQEDFKNMFNFENMADMPNAEELHGHLKGLFDGKIGSLAKELAEELSNDLMGMFSEEGGEIKSTQDIFKQLMKNPKKIMDLMKSVGSKLDAKMKSGEISQEEIMKEAGELMGKMKDMGDGKQFQEMMKNLTKNMPGMGGKNAKFDMSALTRMVSQNTKKDKLRSKLEQRRATAALAKAQVDLQTKQNEGVLESTENPDQYVFKMPEEGVQERSSIKPPPTDDWLEEDKPISLGNTPKKTSKGKKNKKK